MPTKPQRATTTTRPRPLPPPALGEAQRWALTLAEAAGWAVTVEARDGTRLPLRVGTPGRALVILLSSEE